MHITLLTIGSQGDVQPYVALGEGLKKAGYRIRLATHDCFESFVRSRGLDFFSIAGDPRGTLEGEAGLKWLESNKNPFTFVKRMLDAAAPVLWQVMNDYWRACQDTEAILFPTLAALPAASIVEKLNIPAYPAYLQHVHPTRLYPSAMAMPLQQLGGFYNQLTYFIVGHIFWQFIRSFFNRWRKEVLNLPPYPLKGPLGEWLKRNNPCFYGFSPKVVPKAPEWGDEVHITGYWFLQSNETWQPPLGLLDFLDSGPPPIFVGFGSMTNRNPEEVTDIVLNALTRSRQRGLLLTGWGGLSPGKVSDEVFKTDAAPFDWLFPKMAAVVHHGGAGTTATGLRAGVPSIIVPFFGDQHFWAWRVEQLGVGPQPLPRKKLSVERLASAMKEVTTNKEMQNRAVLLGQQIRTEKGVEQVVEIFSHYLPI